jgi:hypothetical protein
MDLRKLIAVIVALILIANLALFSVLRYSGYVFWGILAAGAIVTLAVRKKE